ncbi:MAG TPA: PH domain-containing protein [Pyrinomonadaceae bacterium]|nr:PH domain-containing protein [Pyrinomonadaceae bacterium]
MFCHKCGASNSDDANFCQKCGYQFTDEELTKIATTPKKLVEEKLVEEEDERKVFSIRPTLLFVKIGYVGAVVCAFLLVVLLYYIDKLIFTNPTIPWWFSVLAGLSLLLVPAFYHLKQKTVLYTLTDSKIEIDEGFIFQNSRNVPLRSIQDVSVSSTIIQRMLGFGNLVIDNASEDGGKVILKNINTPKKYADMLLKEMRLLHK